VYLYGGMCPWANTNTSDNSDTSPQASAAYSNRMLRLSPPTTASPSAADGYTLTYAPNTGSGGPIPAAGFTLTELTPSLTTRRPGAGGSTDTGDDNNNNSNDDGNAIVTQQTSHLLLGGHTSQAFVNMSTAAVWSLPEETWSFVAIAAPSGTTTTTGGATELAVRQGAEQVVVDSRSGHTAVLSEDGSAVVVYGGWVGDLNTPAEPQLVILRMGVGAQVGFEGWRWEVPAQGGSMEGRGIYGHGAVLLQGNVMMVWGGYEIAPGAEGNGNGKKRQVAGGQGQRVFFNITSLTWSDKYVNPLGAGSSGGGGSSGSGGGGSGGGTAAPPTDGDEDEAHSSDRSRQIGLGVGLGVGLVVLLLLSAFAVRFFLRRRKRRAARDEALRGLAQGVNGSMPRGFGGDDEMLERDSDDIFPWTASSAREWYTGGHDPYTLGRRSLGYESLRGGKSKNLPSLYIPPPPMSSSSGTRPRGAKGLYTPSTGMGSSGAYDFTPAMRTPTRIEPIYEADEDEDGEKGANFPLNPEKDEDDDDDPFLTPAAESPVGGLFPPPSISGGSPTSRSSASRSPERQPATTHGGRGQEQDADVQGWVSDVDAADSILAARIAQHRSSIHRTPPRQQQQATAPAAGTSRGAPGSPSRRLSTRSGKSARSSKSKHSSLATDALSDSGRTGSNLSERSTFSFAPSVSRLRAAAAGITSSSKNNNTGDAASTHSSSAHTFSTAKSHLNNNNNNNNNRDFAALQAEGPGLLMGSGSGGPSPLTDDRHHYYYNNNEAIGLSDDDYIPVPSSPSKADRRSSSSALRRSWFGSLRRVFSGGTATPDSSSNTTTNTGLGSSRGDSPTWGLGFGGLLPTGTGADYESHHQHLAGGSLQRRRAPQGEHGGDGEGEEWDVERAVEQRLVQVMFTVPREKLRVVNAEVEREVELEEEQVGVVVDPARDWDHDHDHDRDGVPPEEEGAGEVELLSPSPGPGQHPESADNTIAREQDGDRDRHRASTATPESEADPHMHHPLSLSLPLTAGGGGGGISPTPSLRAVSITTTTSTTLHTAEAVRLERPGGPGRRTRVLKMVESFESRSASASATSRGSSPRREGSPVRCVGS
jgi:hypothetical protein